MNDHYSPSQVGMFGRCAEQYRRRYIEGEKIPPGIAMLRGIAVHEGARHNFRQKIDSHEDRPEAEIVEVAAEAMRDAGRGDVSLTDEEAGKGLRAVIDEAIDETRRYAEAHAKLQAPVYQPVLVEERIAIDSGIGGMKLLGILDLADDQDQVVDLKTKSRTPPQADVDSSIPLTTYHALFRARQGREPKAIKHDVLVGLKGGVKRIVLEAKRDMGDYAALAARLSTMHASIQAGNFPPTDPGNWVCSPNWCGYYRTCKYVNPKNAK